MKIVIIGASHVGITAALNLRKLQPEAEVLLIDEDHKDGLGYVSNGINLYLKGKIHSLAEAVNNERTRSEEHTSELQSLTDISYAVFCLKKKKKK